MHGYDNSVAMAGDVVWGKWRLCWWFYNASHSGFQPFRKGIGAEDAKVQMGFLPCGKQRLHSLAYVCHWRQPTPHHYKPGQPLHSSTKPCCKGGIRFAYAKLAHGWILIISTMWIKLTSDRYNLYIFRCFRWPRGTMPRRANGRAGRGGQKEIFWWMGHSLFNLEALARTGISVGWTWSRPSLGHSSRGLHAFQVHWTARLANVVRKRSRRVSS